MTAKTNPDQSVSKVADLLDFIQEDREETLSRPEHEASVGLWYRGLESDLFKLVPTFHRDEIPLGDEIYLMNRFKQNAYQFLDDRPQDEWEWMLLARHHGLPSRLLDWTENPLVGLFFAAGGLDNSDPEADGLLWCLSPGELNRIATNNTLRTDVLPMFSDDAHSPEDEFLNNYRAHSVSNLVSETSRAPAAAIGVRTTKRAQAQLGVFTIHHADKQPIDDWLDKPHLRKYVIPQAAKPDILAELRNAGITKFVLFPELDNAATEAKRGF